jgi:hypothetical protein
MSKPFLPLLGIFAILGADALEVDQLPSPIDQGHVTTHGVCIERGASFNPSAPAAVPRKAEGPAPDDEITPPSESGDVNSFEFAIGVLAHEIGIL